MLDLFRDLMSSLGLDDKSAKRPTLYSLLDESLSPRPKKRESGLSSFGDSLASIDQPEPAAILSNPLKWDLSSLPKIADPKPDLAPADADLPWWRTRTPPAILAEDNASNRRAVDGMLRYADNGDLPNLQAQAIRDYGDKAVGEFGDFMRQLDNRDPTRAKGFEKAVYDKLDDAQKAKHFPEMFGPKQSPAQNMQTAQSRTGGLKKNESEKWSISVGKLSNLSPVEFNTYKEIFAAEGGLKIDRRSGAASGITQEALDRAITGGALPGVKGGTTPNQLSMDDRAKVYRHYFDDVLGAVDRKVPGSSNLSRIGDEKASIAFADAMFTHGRHGGAQAIQNAINKVTPGSVDPDGNMGPDTFAAYRQLAGNPKTNRALLDALGDARRDMIKGRKDDEGWRSRIDHFRFQKSS